MKHWFLVLSSLVIPALAAPAAAQDAAAADAEQRRTDRARTSFQEGVTHVEAGEFVEAEASFRAALEAHDAPSIRYNLASVLVEQGELPEAQHHVDAVLADTSTPADIREHTETLRRHIAERAGHASFEVDGAAGASVSVDGYVLTDPRAQVPLSPGHHVATATVGGQQVAQTAFEVTAGDHHDVALVAEGDLEVTHDPAEGQAASRPIHEEWWLWTIVGGGAVVLAVVIGVAVAVSSGPTLQAPLAGDFSPGVLTW